MKKILMALFASAVAASVATAGIGIGWTTLNWGENHLGDGSGTANEILSANDVLWQLIFAGTDNMADPIHDDGVVDPMDPAAWAANNYLRPGGDDQLLASRIVPMGGGVASDGTVWDVWLTYQSGSDPLFENLSWSQAGFVYQRVFESSTPMSGSTYFYQTGLLALDTTYAGGTSSPQAFFVDPSAPFIPNQQAYAVPEPATMGLLGLGALVMAIRRRRS